VTCLIRPLFLGSKGDLLIQVQLYFILFCNYNSNTPHMIKVHSSTYWTMINKNYLPICTCKRRRVIIYILNIDNNNSRRRIHTIKFVSDLPQVGGFFLGTPVSSTNKTDCQDITEILLKVALNTISHKPYHMNVVYKFSKHTHDCPIW
jgi:hypothetical protein